MDITRTDVDELNAQLTIKLDPKDYQERVGSILSDYKKKMNMPGFRPGKVPMGMVKKMYGKAVLAEELNKVFSDKLMKYLTENKLDVLGQPLPSAESNNKIDLEMDGEVFEFTYDLGLAPQFDVNLSSKDKLDYFKIIIDETLIDKYAKDIAKRYGKVSNSDAAGDEDMLHGIFRELDKEGNEVEGGMHAHSTISIEFVEDSKAKKQLLGAKIGDKLTVDPNKITRGPGDIAQMLNISQSKAESMKQDFSFEIEQVYHMEPADLNQELFDKLYGPDQVKSEEEFRNKIREELEKNLQVDSDRKFYKDLSDKLISKLKIKVPEGFLRRWIIETNEEMDETKLEEEWDRYLEGIKWQIIESKIVKENELNVTHKEAVDHTKELYRKQMEMYGYKDIPDAELDGMVANTLAKEDEARKIYDQLFEERLMKFYKETVSLKEKELSFDDFVKLVNKQSGKNKILDSLSNLVKF